MEGAIGEILPVLLVAEKRLTFATYALTKNINRSEIIQVAELLETFPPTG